MSRVYGLISGYARVLGIGNITITIYQYSYGIKTIVQIVILLIASLLRDKLLAADVQSCQRAILVILRKHLRKRSVGINKIINRAELGYLCYIVLFNDINMNLARYLFLIKLQWAFRIYM